MVPIPQSTSLVVVFKMFTAGTSTEATGKTVAVTISKAGGAFGNPNAGATNATEISGGWYKATMDTTDTNTLGLLAVRGTAAGCDDYGDRFFVNVPAVNVTQFGGSAGTFSSGRPEVNTTHIGGTSQTARDIGSSVLLSSGTGTGQVKLSSGYVAPNWGDVGNPTTTVNLSGTTVGTLTTYTGNTPQTGDSYAIVNNGTYGNAQLARTAALPANFGTLSITNGQTISTLTQAQVNTEADAALSDVGLTSTVTGRIDAAVSSRSSQASVDDLPTNSELATALGAADDAVLSAINALSIPTAEAIAEAVFLVDMADVEDAAPEHSLCYVVLASSEWSESGGTLTVKKTDGTTFATKTVTKTSGDSPIRSMT